MGAETMTDFGRRVAEAAHAYTHHVGGTDLVEFPRLTARVHAGRHEPGGDDVIDISGMAVALHKATHQDGGTDKISVAGLLGVLANAQPSTWVLVSGKPSTYPPSGHHASHEAGGADIVAMAGLDGTPQSDDFSAIKEPLFWRHYTSLTNYKAVRWDRGVNPGFLTMISGKETDWSGNSYTANFPYQVVTGDFQVDTKIVLDASPGKQWKSAGICLVFDRYNSIKLSRTYSTEEILQLLYVVGDSNYVTEIAFSTNTFWLRVIRSGTAFTSWHSINGTDYTQIANPATVFTAADPMWVGPQITVGSSQTEAFDAKFDFFNFS